MHTLQYLYSYCTYWHVDKYRLNLLLIEIMLRFAVEINSFEMHSLEFQRQYFKRIILYCNAVCQCNGHGVCTNDSNLTIDATLEGQLVSLYNALDVSVADPFVNGSNAALLQGSSALATCAACFNHTHGAHCGSCTPWYFGDPSNGAFCSRMAFNFVAFFFKYNRVSCSLFTFAVVCLISF